VVLREALSNDSTSFARLITPVKNGESDGLSLASPQVSTVKRNYRPNNRLTAAQRTQLAEQYQHGMSALELARQYGINRHTVTKHLKREGVAVRGGMVRMTPDILEQAKQLYANSYSLVTIGGHLGVDASTVHKALKKAGVKLRDSHGRPT
jgi:transposase-like protein